MRASFRKAGRSNSLPKGVLLACACLNALSAQVSPNSLITRLPTAKWNFAADGFAGTNAPISELNALATDPNGNIIFADPGNHVVLRLNSDGTVAVLAGNGLEGFAGDNGPALAASLDRPSDAVMDRAGNLYIYDEFNHRIRRVTPDGTITTYAGTGASNETGDSGSALKAGIGSNDRLAIDSAGNLYISNRCQIRRIDTNGIINVFAGTRRCVHGPDGPALQTDMNPDGMTFDSEGNLYFAESSAHYIRRIGTDGMVTTVIGDGSLIINFPHSLVVDSGGNLYYSDVNNEVVIRIGADESVAIVTGTGVSGFSGDGGPASQASVFFPHGLALDSSGDLYMADSGNFRVRRIRAGNIETVVGNAQFRYVPDGTPAAQASLYGPNNLAFDRSGNLLISEVSMHEVTQILAADSTFQVLAGIGIEGNGGGPLATRSLIDHPRQVAVDSQGSIYFVDNTNSVVYRETPDDGNLTRIAGTPFVTGYSGDNGPAVTAVLNSPWGIAVDNSGNVFVADTSNNVIRRISTDGTITTYAGTGNAGFSGDNGPASAAQLNSPYSLAIDPNGNLLVCDRSNNRIRKIDPSGVIATIAGNGQADTTGDGGPATAAAVNSPFAIAVDPDGAILLITSGGRRLRRIDRQGNISTIAGDGLTRANQGDGGPAGNALLDVDDVAVDSFGNVFLASFDDDSIRVILNFEPNLYLTNPSFNEFPNLKISLRAVSGGELTPHQSVAVDGAFTGVVFRATADQPWLVLENAQGTTPSTMSFSADPSKLKPGDYTGNISLARMGSPQPFAKVTVAFNVVNQLPPNLSVQPPSISLATAIGAANQPSTTIHLTNTGSGSLDYQIHAFGAGLSTRLSQISGTVIAGAPQNVVINLDPDKLTAGTFTGSLVITSSVTGQTVTIPVALSVAARPQRMLLSQKGVMFTAVKNGGTTPAQSFSVLDEGGGSFDWTARAIQVGGGPSWFSISPLAGTSVASATPPAIMITADPSALSKPGVYYGLVRVTSQNAANAPQDIEVVLNYLGPGTNAGAAVSRSGLVFVAPAGTSSPSSQSITVTNLNSTALGISPQAVTFDGIPWLTVIPNAARQQIAAGGSLRLTVAATVNGLKTGVHQATVLLQFPAPLSNREVNVQFIVTPVPGLESTKAVPVQRGPMLPMDITPISCKPTQLIPLFSSLFSNSSTPAAWPQPLESLVVDDCGQTLTSGRVVASFSNGEPPVSLVALGDGRWEGTWFGRKSGSALEITLSADSQANDLHGAQTYDGYLQANEGVPVIAAGGIQDPASNGQQASVGPGSIITFSGTSFAAAPSATSQLPLSTDLLGSEATLAGVNLPLVFAGPDLIHAVVPYDLQPGQYLAVITRGNALSGPEPIIVGSAQPSVLRVTTQNDPQAPQAIWTQLLAGRHIDPASIPPGSAVTAGDVLMIYATGLGSVTPALDPAHGAPSPAPTVQNPVTLTIGTITVPVSSASLVPGHPGIYLVQATLPNRITPGDGIPLAISVLGQSSSPINVSVR
jgi:uncharacterized protein (TIGR03437 family)